MDGACCPQFVGPCGDRRGSCPCKHAGFLSCAGSRGFHSASGIGASGIGAFGIGASGIGASSCSPSYESEAGACGMEAVEALRFPGANLHRLGGRQPPQLLPPAKRQAPGPNPASHETGSASAGGAMRRGFDDPEAAMIDPEDEDLFDDHEEAMMEPEDEDEDIGDDPEAAMMEPEHEDL